MFSDLIQKIRTVLGSNTHCDFPRMTTHLTCPQPEPEELEDENSIALKVEELKGTVYDNIRTIHDPEKPASLEELQVVYEDGIQVLRDSRNLAFKIVVEFNPTVPHCNLATLIGLCIRVKLERNIVDKFKLDIFVKKGSHNIEEEINKQINDKERVAAALENPALCEIVEECIKDNE